MPELLLRVIDKINSDDPHLDARMTKRGDVIVVCPDGHDWGKDELSAPYWRIISVAAMPMLEAQEFLAQESGDQRLNRMLQKRIMKFDIDNLPPPIKNAIDAPRTGHIIVSAALVATAKKVRAARPDPNVLKVQ